MSQSDVNRRDFAKLLSLITTGLLVSRSAHALGSSLSPSGDEPGGFKQLAIDEIALAFPTPQNDARPWVYWFWMRGYVTREGVTADLEAMQRVGIGGVLIMEVNFGTPPGPSVAGASPLDFMSLAWREMFEFVCSEAHRLGLKVNMNNDAGWDGSGGPWITLETSMQKVVWTQTNAEGGKRIDDHLKLPEHTDGYKVPPIFIAPSQSAELTPIQLVGPSYYRDIAVLALPTPSGEPYNIPNGKALADGSGKYTVLQQNIPEPANWPTVPAGRSVPLDSIVDISKHMDSNGRLVWDTPPGKWTILRLGHTSTGVPCHPAPISGTGLECDKLSKSATKLQFDSLMGKLIADVGTLAGNGKTLVATHIDSWESGSQNWTLTFREDFKRLRGYDITPYLPAIAGLVVGDMEISGRFLWDFRKTISDLLVENYAACMRDLAAKHGLRLTIEGYAGVPADELDYGGQAVEPMGEIWSWPRFQNWTNAIEMTSAAHTYGHRIIGSETFTANGNEKWQGYPAEVKDVGDWAFCAGINRFVFCLYAMQPWTNPHYAPGMSMGPCGLHYDRTQTWWEQTKPWHEYVARCQYLLRQGLFVADICYLQPEGEPRAFNPQGGPLDFSAGLNAYVAPPRPGYNYDGCTSEVVLTRMRVQDGRLVLPDGMSYRVLVLPASDTMTPTLLKKIKALVDEGATVIGPRPVKSPSLSNYPHCDVEIQKLVAELWDTDKIITGKTAEQVLAHRGVPPDFVSDQEGINFCHRKTDSADIYFVANPNSWPVDAVCTFRVKNKQPEFWDPETGRIEPSCVWEKAKDGTRVLIRLGYKGSMFVVFRKHAVGQGGVIHARRDGQTVASLQPVPIVVWHATYGVLGDTKRMHDVTAIVAAFAARGRLSFPVVELAQLGDPAPGVVKTLKVTYLWKSKELALSATDGQAFSFNPLREPAPAMIIDLQGGTNGRVQVAAFAPGRYQLVQASGAKHELTVSTLPSPLEISGPWSVNFPPGWGAPAEIELDKLISWPEHRDSGVRYFSGKAVYSKFISVPKEFVALNQRVYLDLGRVAVIAEVRLNGQNMGILWKPPFRIDITEALQLDENKLEISVTNLWINRMIGDQHLPEDPDRYLGPTWWHGTLDKWPQWLLEGKANPSGRYSFTTWQLWNKNDPLVESGLIGPVKLSAAVVLNLKQNN